MAIDEGDLVLDSVMGSGTTGRVSKAHKRFFVGYDIKQYSGDCVTIHRQLATLFLAACVFLFHFHWKQTSFFAIFE